LQWEAGYWETDFADYGSTETIAEDDLTQGLVTGEYVRGQGEPSYWEAIDHLEKYPGPWGFDRGTKAEDHTAQVDFKWLNSFFRVGSREIRALDKPTSPFRVLGGRAFDQVASEWSKEPKGVLDGVNKEVLREAIAHLRLLLGRPEGPLYASLIADLNGLLGASASDIAQINYSAGPSSLSSLYGAEVQELNTILGLDSFGPCKLGGCATLHYVN
jgi:hypothetical protein